jgi:hypothetical protein
MVTSVVKDDIVNLKNKLENIENKLENQLKDLSERENMWKRMEELVIDLNSKQTDIIQLNIGGKKFKTRIETLLANKDTLFHTAITSNKFDLTTELFFDRDNKMFPYILDYLRNEKLKYQRFTKSEIAKLLREAEYYEITDMVDYLTELRKTIEFKRFEFSGCYMSGSKVAGTNIIEDITDRSCTKGICAKSPGFITIELNAEWEFEEIEIGGCNHSTSIFSPTNGANATVLTSKDGASWVDVGRLPANYNQHVQVVKLRSSFARFIKFQSNNNIGIGYLNIKKKKIIT